MKVNDVLEEFAAALKLLSTGTYETIRKCDDFKFRLDIPKDMVFELLCAAHERATKDEIREVLDQRIND